MHFGRFLIQVQHRTWRRSSSLLPSLSSQLLTVPVMIRYHASFSFLIYFLSSVSSFTFLPPPSCHSRAATFSRTTRRGSLLQAVDNHDCENIIIVASIDGVVLDTRDLRIHQGIQAAVDTWPHLSDLVLGNNDTSWLLNKMKALSHCMTTHVGYSVSCDYALLARLLLEEQVLDEGRSSGQKGKYASRFHPSIPSFESNVAESSNSNPNASSSINRSRPLTVGEIEVNWSDGACLSETLLSRYNIDKKNPLAAIQESIQRQCNAHDDESKIMPIPNEVVSQALSKCTHGLILRVGHACDLQMIQSCLQNTTPLQDIPVVSTVQEAISIPNQTCLLVDDSLSDMQLYKQMLLNASPQSTLHVIHNSWDSLRRAKVLFGDYIPRQHGKAKTVYGKNQQLSLHLWSDSTSIALRNSAEMDPWTNLMTRQDLMDLIYAGVSAYE